MHPFLWIGLFVVFPLAVLGSMTVFGSRAAVAYVVVCACLWLMVWFSSAGFKTNHYLLDPEHRTLVITPEFDDPDTQRFATVTGTDERTVNIDEVDSLQLIPLGTFVGARLSYRSHTFTKPEGVLIPREQLRQVVASFRSYGVSVPELGAGDRPTPQRRPLRAVVRIAATPVLIGVLLGSALLAAVTSVVSVLLYSIWSFTEYRRLRDRIPEPRPPSPFAHPTRLVTILIGNHELDTYGQRVQKTGVAFLVVLFFLGILARILMF
jgi:hypothetical protein